MRYKLGEIFNLQMGKTPDRHSPKFWNEGTEPWISIADLTKCIKYIENTAEKITATAVDESGIKIIPKNTVIMSFKLSIGKVAITPKEMYSNEAIMSFIDKGVLKIEPVYLYYLLMHKDWDTDTNKAVMGKTLNKATLSQMTVYIHGYSEQLEIIKALDAASSIIAARKQQLTELDNLIKARFVELFGDPMDNPLGWDRVNISTVIGGKVSNGFFAKRDDYCNDGNVKVLGVAHVVNRMYSNIEDLPTTNGSETDIIKYGVKYGDMLFCRSSLVAAGIGKASIVPQGTPNNVLFECHVIRLPLDLDKCVPEFMQVLSTTDYFRNQVISRSKTATMTTIGQDGILKTDIILPPLEFQRQFLQFVKQTDKSKVAVQKALDEAQLLFDSLMQKYFG